MSSTTTTDAAERHNSRQFDHEVIVIGAGVCGIYQLHRLLELGVDVTVLETGSGPGGTWFWNRYPGARFDSESWTYGYSFSPELLDEWEWSEHFAAQPETLRYLEHVVDKFDLAGHMQFNCTVERAVFDDKSDSWTVHVSDGRTLTCRFLLTAIGLLSAPALPRIDGVESFQGLSFHTFHWPAEPIDLSDKRVAVIGTGATGVQVIAEIADKVGELTVFQRHPNWCAPLNNSPITPEQQAEIKATYDQIFAKCATTPGGFIHGPQERPMAETTTEERYALWEDLYNSPGFGIWLGNYRETLMDEEANAEITAFIAEKIRQRVHDPVTADKLIPKDHGFGTHRVPMETRYYEAYNRENVHLVDLLETPIESITPRGIKTTAAEFDFDVIVYATGFDAITGAFNRIDFIGTDGQHLRDKWSGSPVTYLGMMIHGFPNLITLAGPTAGSVSTNFPRGIEDAVDWATRLLAFSWERGITRLEADEQAERDWTDHVREMYGFLLLRHAKSWMTGYNANVEGSEKTRYMIYAGGSPRYRKRLSDEADTGYPNLIPPTELGSGLTA